MASFVAFALVLATALVAHPVIAVCSLNQHAALSPRGQLSVYLNNCYSGATTYFAGNYTVVTISKDVYTLRFGDQLCGTAPTVTRKINAPKNFGHRALLIANMQTRHAAHAMCGFICRTTPTLSLLQFPTRTR